MWLTVLWSWEFLPPLQHPQIFTGRGFWGFISSALQSWVRSLSYTPIVTPGLSTRKCGAARSTSHHLACPGPPAATLPWVLLLWMPMSHPRTGVDECFFFNSLVVRLPYSSIFWHFWLIFVSKFVVVLLLVVQAGKVYLPCLHLGWKSSREHFNGCQMGRGHESWAKMWRD